ncbi:MAG: glycosyltransferase family 39 protein, partial [Xanthomonas perforans]|nr:glycosyltransferase family 39 protein [Xanthomonas perforans]
AVSVPSIRAHAAGEKYYPRNFAGWKDLARTVKLRLAQMPPGTRVLAENFKVGAELGFQLHDANVEVLRAELNDKHGRSAQLQQWGLLSDGTRAGPRLLVLSPSDQRYRDLLKRYH